MIDLSDVKKTDKKTCLFITTRMQGQAAYLLHKADKNIRLYHRRRVLMNDMDGYEVSEEFRMNQMKKNGFDNDDMEMPVAIISNYDVDELFDKLKFIKDGEIDSDYFSYKKEMVYSLPDDVIVEEGIPVRKQ